MTKLTLRFTPPRVRCASSDTLGFWRIVHRRRLITLVRAGILLPVTPESDLYIGITSGWRAEKGPIFELSKAAEALYAQSSYSIR
jgi:hypothetical protein